METLYLLIKTETGTLKNVLKKVIENKHVVDASAVTGAYDIIAKIQTGWIVEAMGAVIRDIRKINGVKSTETLVCIRI